MANWDDDELGYGKPPIWTQFQKGRSGNPNGRPKTKTAESVKAPPDSELDDIIRSELARELTVTENGKPVKMKMRQLLVRALHTTGLKGNPIAQRESFRQITELEVKDRERAEATAAERRQTYERIVAKRAERAKVWAAAEGKGCEPDQAWPHPDDIILFPDSETWTVVGPWDASDLPRFEFLRAQRDMLFADSILHMRTRKRGQSMGSLNDLWICYDMMLPRRWQIRGDDLNRLVWFLERVPLADIRALAKRQKRDADAMPPPEVTAEARRYAYQFTNQIMKPGLRCMGYRSLAQFDKALEEHGPGIPWPRTPKSKAEARQD